MKKVRMCLEKLSKRKKIGISVGILFLFACFIIIPISFATLEPVRSITITSSKANYEDKESGSWQIEKSAKWIKKGIAEITFDVDTVLKTHNQYTDILFVLDISGSMDGDKLDRVKIDTVELITTLLSNNKNRAGLITFDSSSKIVSELTNDKDSLIEKINNLTVTGSTNYYQALVNVDTILKNYQKEKNRECIILFLTDGYPNEDIPNEEAEYRYLKNVYPYVTINGVQYEMGNDILDPIKKVSDNQYIADIESLNNVLFDASVSPAIYENFEITDFIDTNYFYVESEDDIKVSEGKVTFDKDHQTVNWKMDSLKSGSSAKMTIKAKLKDELIGQGGVYPTNTKEEITSKIEEQEEDEVSTKTPILADNYKVSYEGNAPEGCSAEGVPKQESKSVFDVVGISEEKPTCEGYEFKGWEITTENVTKVNDDYFIMPENDVVLKATWGRVKVAKSMDGTVSVIQTFYKMMKSLAVPDDEESEFVTSSTGIDFSKEPSNRNGKGVYQLASSKNETYPILYYRGKVANNNVKFGGFCWKIVRTTETGGVKLVYNGEPDESGNCTNTTGATTQIGTSTFNNSYTSPADIGYMYGNRSNYTSQSQSIPTWYDHIERSATNNRIVRETYSDSTNYYYGDTITWDTNTKRYIISNSDGSEAERMEWNIATYQGLKGKYTCRSETASTCSTVSYVTNGIGSYMYYLELSNNQTLEDVNTTWNYGKEIVYENGVYTIQNPTEGKSKNWYSEYSKYLNNYVCPDGGVSCTNIWYIVGTSDSQMRYVEMSNGETYDSMFQEALNIPWIYGNDVEWDGSKYILKDIYESSPVNWKNDYKTIATKYHYTCFNTTGECTEVGYIHHFNSKPYIYHLKLKRGKNIEDAKKEMFSNTTDSKMKQTIDNWYATHMIDYTDKLEDTVWCNDRSINRGPLKSKDEDSSIDGNVSIIYFGAEERNEQAYKPSVQCPREEDKFTVSSEFGNGKLTYPVALLTADDLTLAGHGKNDSNSSYLYTGSSNWTLSPRYFDSDTAGMFYLYSGNLLSSNRTNKTNGIRPAVSLAPDTIIASGDGSQTDPFEIETNTEE